MVVWLGDEIRLRVPIHNLESIVSMGYTGASPALMQLCAERGVAVAFHSPNGRLLARVTPANKGNVLLRKRQYQMHDDPGETMLLVVAWYWGNWPIAELYCGGLFETIGQIPLFLRLKWQ